MPVRGRRNVWVSHREPDRAWLLHAYTGHDERIRQSSPALSLVVWFLGPRIYGLMLARSGCWSWGR
jgi:hypothetical protein